MRAALFAVIVGCGRVTAQGSVCDGMKCTLYDTPREAFARVLEDQPRVLAVGETHARAGTTNTTALFADSLLPALKGRSSDLVLELWVASPSCTTQQKKEVARVTSVTHEVTATQSPKNPSEFVALYNAARKNEMRAHLLVPPCDEYARIANAGPGDVDAMLAMIARLSAEKTEELLPTATGPIVIYGGAMHNDLLPREGEERWTFGPRLAAESDYVELDLIAADAIKDEDVWRAQPWYPHFKRSAQGKKTVLFKTRPGSWALIFPAQ